MQDFLPPPLTLKFDLGDGARLTFSAAGNVRVRVPNSRVADSPAISIHQWTRSKTRLACYKYLVLVVVKYISVKYYKDDINGGSQ